MSKKEFIKNDQFYTKISSVALCMKIFEDFVKKNMIDMSEYTVIEPSVGSGNFYNMIDSNIKKIPIDLFPDEQFKINNPNMLHMDYLDFLPNEEHGNKFMVIGNPPFGMRGALAKKFIKHSMIFSDYIFFILPMGLISNVFRNDLIKNFKCNITQWTKLPTNSFTFPDGEECDIDTVFAIIQKIDSFDLLESKNKKVNPLFSIKHININDLKKTYNKNEIYHIGAEHMTGADFYIPHIVYKNNPDNFKLYDTFEELKSNVGWAIFTNNKDIRELLKTIDFSKYTEKISNLSGMRYSIRKKLLNEFIESIIKGEEF